MEKKSLLKIAVVGAESTGKSWLCAALAEAFQTTWVKEYAREYFNHSDIYNYSLNDLECIAKEQLRMERECLRKANLFLFCDTAMITLQIWSELEFQTITPELKTCISQGDYDFYLLCDNAVNWMPDPQRLNKFSRALIFEMNQKAIEQLSKPYAVVSGEGEERIQNAVSILRAKFL